MRKVISVYPARRVVLIGLMAVLAVALLASVSCSTRTTRRIAFDLKSPDAHLKKQVGLAYLRNQTSFGDPGLVTIFERELITNLQKEAPMLLILKPGDNDFPEAVIEPPLLANGQIDNLALAQAGRQIGLNAIVVNTLYDVHPEREKTGMLWFKGQRAYIFVQILTDVYDTLTAAKILDKNYTYEIELDAAQAAVVSNDMTLTSSAIITAMSKLMPDISEDISDVVLTKPWRGFIRATSGNKVFISSGRRVGIRKADQFEVVQSDRILDGVDGQRFYLPSEPYAKVKVTTVFPAWSETVTLEGGPISAGSFLRPLK